MKNNKTKHITEKQNKIASFAILIVAIIIMVAACQPSKVDKPVVTPTPVASTSTSAENTLLRNAFMDGCLDGDNKQQAACSCLFDEITKDIGAMGFAEASEAKQQSLMADAVVECVHLYK